MIQLLAGTIDPDEKSGLFVQGAGPAAQLGGAAGRGGGFLDNGQLARFYSLRKAVKSVQILGPSSGGVPIAVCKFCGAGTHWSRDLALSQ